MTTTDRAERPRHRSLRQRVGGIRLRVVVAYVGLLTIALGVSIVITRELVLDRVNDEIDQQLTQEVEELRLVVERDDGRSPMNVADIFHEFMESNEPDAQEQHFYTFIDGRIDLRSHNSSGRLAHDRQLVQRWTSVSRAERGTYDTALGEVRALVMPVSSGGNGPDGTFVVAYLPGGFRSDADATIRMLTIASVVVLVVSAIIAWSLAGRVVRPIRELTDTTKRVSHSDLSARIPTQGHDEVAELGDTFNAMIQRLEDGFEHQRQFLDDVAHELRTPITIARGHLDTIGDTPEERDEAVAIVADELDRMARYVSDLLVLAKAGHPDFLRLGPVDLGELATTVHHRVEAIGNRRWVLEEAPPEGTVAVVADFDRLIQAMVNLATNAVQHTGDGDEIGIGVLHLDDRYELWVRDTGPGIDPTVLDDLFNRYARSTTNRVSRPEGMGIGLSIVTAIATAHGGALTARNLRGSGAMFTIAAPDEPEEDLDGTGDEPNDEASQ